MKSKIFFVIQKEKDGTYFHETDEEGNNWFVSTLRDAKQFPSRTEAFTKIKELQNWLKRPKFNLITGQYLTPR